MNYIDSYNQFLYTRNVERKNVLEILQVFSCLSQTLNRASIMKALLKRDFWTQILVEQVWNLLWVGLHICKRYSDFNFDAFSVFPGEKRNSGQMWYLHKSLLAPKGAPDIMMTLQIANETIKQIMHSRFPWLCCYLLEMIRTLINMKW